MITFEEARLIVERSLRGSWRPDHGTLITLPTGFQNDTHWRVIAGAREYLVERDSDFATVDAPAMLVSKRTGEVSRLIVIDSLNLLGSMTPAP
jgi:hypothetical protein